MQQIKEVLVDANWLIASFSSPIVKMVDASWFMPGSGRNPEEEWRKKRIPGAVFFDYDREIKDKTSLLPHMLPSVAQFEEYAGKMGIKNDDTVVIYDSIGMFSAPRAWWMFKVMGHKNAVVLDGGLPAWEKVGGKVDTIAPIQPLCSTYKAIFQLERYITRDGLLHGILDDELNVIDVRPAERFYGKVEEPRPGLRSGHMPNAINLPFASFLEGNVFKSKDDIRTLLFPLISNKKPNVTSCGSGVTACIVALAGEHVFGNPFAVYDGSWSEWGSDHDLPIVKY